MKLMKRILLIISFAFICLVVIGLFLPTEYTVTRSINIDSTQEKIHKYVGELNNWDKWSPWLESDPTIKVNVGEKTSGVGATQSWEGKDGSGSLVFTATDPQKGIDSVHLKEERTQYWLGCGAQASETVGNIIRKKMPATKAA